MRPFALVFSSAFVFVLGGCAAGDAGRDNPIFTSTGNTGNEVGDGDGDGDETGEGEGDGDPTTTGDGDGDPTTTGDGDGDPTTTGDGDGDAQCGNDMKEGDEECDGNDLGGLNCLDFGFQDGTLVCANDCTIFTNACSTCGDGQLAATEACDGGNFGGLTCTDLGFAGGNLTCSADCQTVIESGCMQAPTCGNGAIDGGEECDGGNLNGSTCQSLGFDAGSLSCTAGCQLNTANCTTAMCQPLLSTCNPLLNDCCEGLDCIPVFGCLPSE